MEQEKAQQTYTHLLVQAHARSRMTTKACMYEQLEKHKSIIRARWNNKKH